MKSAAKVKMSEGSKKKGARKYTSQLDTVLHEAKAAYSDLSSTGGRQLRKRPQVSQSTSAPPKKKAKKPAKTPKKDK